MIGKVLVGAVGAVISVGLAAPAGASPVQHTPQDFLAAVRAAGITGTDPAILGDGYRCAGNCGISNRVVRWPRTWCKTIN